MPRHRSYNGDADYILSHMGNANWINNGLKLKKQSEWKKWRGSDGQVAGYFEEYATSGKPLTFLTVKGAGSLPNSTNSHCHSFAPAVNRLVVLTLSLTHTHTHRTSWSPSEAVCDPLCLLCHPRSYGSQG